MKVSALIPVKGFSNAKQRLSPLLDAADRELFAEVMFRDVLKQVLKARGLVETYVVTGDNKVAEIAASLGAQLIREKAEKGETDAVDFARGELKQLGREAVLIIPGDMPLVRSADIEEVLAQVPKDASRLRCWCRRTIVWGPTPCYWLRQISLNFVLDTIALLII